MKPMQKSFYDWCVENDRQDLLERWDYELNNKSPKEVARCNEDEYWFTCPKGLHKSELRKITSLVSKNNSTMKCRACNSFAQWGIDNLGKDFLDKYWDYEKNIDINPWVIPSQWNKYVWLKLNGNNSIESFNLKCSNFFKSKKFSLLAKIKVHIINSFAQFCIENIDKNFIEKYWSDKNTIDPWEIGYSSDKKVWIKCQEKDYHDDYEIMCSNFIKGQRCLFCAHRGKLVNKLDSLGYLHPEVFLYWSDKNEKSPYQYYSQSNQKVWWKCLEGKHEDYQRAIGTSFKLKFRCPMCVRERKESFLQEKVRIYIEQKYPKYKLNHEYGCTLIPQNPKIKDKNGNIDNRGHLPFDNEIEELKLIIEVHGEQHYSVKPYTSVWFKKNGVTPKERLHYQQLKDRYKKYIAFLYGYKYLEISYKSFSKNVYKKLIDDKIKLITNQIN